MISGVNVSCRLVSNITEWSNRCLSHNNYDKMSVILYKQGAFDFAECKSDILGKKSLSIEEDEYVFC